jgi:hypothetical protein
MVELIWGLLGLYMIYSFIHLALLQKKAWCMRNTYEKFVTISALVLIGLTFLGLMFP